jgi:hypothetical protein
VVELEAENNLLRTEIIKLKEELAKTTNENNIINHPII